MVLGFWQKSDHELLIVLPLLFLMLNTGLLYAHWRLKENDRALTSMSLASIGIYMLASIIFFIAGLKLFTGNDKIFLTFFILLYILFKVLFVKAVRRIAG